MSRVYRKSLQMKNKYVFWKLRKHHVPCYHAIISLGIFLALFQKFLLKITRKYNFFRNSSGVSLKDSIENSFKECSIGTFVYSFMYFFEYFRKQPSGNVFRIFPKSFFWDFSKHSQDFFSRYFSRSFCRNSSRRFFKRCNSGRICSTKICRFFHKFIIEKLSDNVPFIQGFTRDFRYLFGNSSRELSRESFFNRSLRYCFGFIQIFLRRFFEKFSHELLQNLSLAFLYEIFKEKSRISFRSARR